MKRTITVEDVDKEIASGTTRLSFSSPIESVFERDTAAQRTRMMTTAGIAAFILYDLFLAADWFTLHDMFWSMVLARLGIFTPIGILVVVFANRWPSKFRREGAAILMGMIGVFLPMAVMTFSDSPHKLNYQYGSLLVMMCCTVVLRVRFYFAAVGLACMLTIQLTTTHYSGAFDALTYLRIALFYATASVLLALTTYFLEHADRRGFLYALRGELLREQIEASARTDPLTGLFNRRHLTNIADAFWTSDVDGQRRIAAILIDIDHFKSFNDSRGHLEGDACLRIVSDRIASIADDHGGLSFRFGGEEMLVLLPDADIADAMRAAEAIRAAIEAAAVPHPVIGGVVTASLGVAGVAVAGTTPGDLIAAADTALYVAKGDGRNRVQSAPVSATVLAAA